MSADDFEVFLPEMDLPPELPPDEDATVVVVSAVEWPALEQFDTYMAALSWACYQKLAGSPKYYVHQLYEGRWEAIQSWIRNL